MGAAGLESHLMVGVDTSRPDLPGLPTNVSANTIPSRSRTSMKAFEVVLGKQNK
jgi:hypothetical protein